MATYLSSSQEVHVLDPDERSCLLEPFNLGTCIIFALRLPSLSLLINLSLQLSFFTIDINVAVTFINALSSSLSARNFGLCVN